MTQSKPQNTLAPWAELAPNVGPMTAEELLALPEDNWRYELVEGRLVRMSPTGGEHGVVAGELHGALRDWVRAHRLGKVLSAETGFLTAGSTVLAPDVAYVRASHIPPKGNGGRKGFWQVAPDIVAEVASPSQFHPELEAKAQAWLEAGVSLVWLVWPDSEQVDVWRMVGDDTARQPLRIVTLGVGDALDGLDVLPGFSYPLNELFA